MDLWPVWAAMVVLGLLMAGLAFWLTLALQAFEQLGSDLVEIRADVEALRRGLGDLRVEVEAIERRKVTLEEANRTIR
jgi:hypothetical protein